MLETHEGGCHCGRVRFRARVDLDLLSQCNCTVCTKKGILHLPVEPENFELLRGKNSLTTYTFGTGVAQHTFCSHCGMHAFYVPRSQPDSITVNGAVSTISTDQASSPLGSSMAVTGRKPSANGLPKVDTSPPD
jgi:hypothetical protein